MSEPSGDSEARRKLNPEYLKINEEGPLPPRQAEKLRRIFEGFQRYRQEFEKETGEPWPGSLDAWLEEFYRAGVHHEPHGKPFDKFTLRELAPRVKGYLRGVRDLRRTAEGTQAASTDKSLDGPEEGSTPEPLSMHEEKVLLCLLDSQAVLRRQLHISEYTKISPNSVATCLKRLETNGLVHRPKGKRSGYGLTDRGKEVADRLANQGHPLDD